MTFLNLVKRTAAECGVDPSAITTVVNQVGEVGRLVDWVASAWVDIQQKHATWRFLRRSTSWPTVEGQSLYTPTEAGIASETFGQWAPATARVYHTASGLSSEQWLSYRPWDQFRDLWLFGATRAVTSWPIEVTVDPENRIGVGPAPTAGLTLSVDYYRTPVLLAADTDVPALPPLHSPLIIVYRAMMFYGGYWAAREVYARGEAEYRRLLTRLEADQLPPVQLAGALA